ncbi:hypothetical protein VF21_02309 [Pseudogymnoascus sp. 05NY08]|nr:hypothetical protein VF21_02309 [Pseudogymnoascus sp. 05NY08]
MLLETGARLPEYYNTFSTLCIQDNCYYGHGQVHHVPLVVDRNLYQEEGTEGASLPEWPDSHASAAAIVMRLETVVEEEEEEAAATVYIVDRDRHDEMSTAVAAVGSVVDVVDDTEVRQSAAWAPLAVNPRRRRFCFGTCFGLDSGFCSCSYYWHGN